jgi:hypothetical protein
MPYQTRKVRGKNCYKVFTPLKNSIRPADEFSSKLPVTDLYKNVNKKTRKGTIRKTQRVFAKCATAENAKKQMNLLRAIKNNKNFVPNSSKKG